MYISTPCVHKCSRSIPYVFCLAYMVTFVKGVNHLPSVSTSVNRDKYRHHFSPFFFLVYWDRVSLCSPGQPGTYFVAHDGLKFVGIILPRSLKCWDYRRDYHTQLHATLNWAHAMLRGYITVLLLSTRNEASTYLIFFWYSQGGWMNGEGPWDKEVDSLRGGPKAMEKADQ